MSKSSFSLSFISITKLLNSLKIFLSNLLFISGLKHFYKSKSQIEANYSLNYKI